MNIPQRLRQLAASTGLDGFAHELRAIADEMEAQPADVTDAHIVAVMRDGNNCNYNDEADHIQFARAILALRPAQVSMTREQAMAIVQSNPDTMTAIRMAEARHGIKPKEQA